MQLPFYSVGLHCVATIIFVNEAIVSGRELGEVRDALFPGAGHKIQEEQSTEVRNVYHTK